MFIMKFLKLSALFVLLIFSSCSTPKSYINMRTAPDTFYPNENTKQIYVCVTTTPLKILIIFSG